MQDGAKDCGICSLLSIIRYYGGDVPKEKLRLMTNTTREGVNAYSLLEAGRKLGFDTKGVSGSVFDIDKKYLPCIAHVVIDNSYKHFVVIYNVDKKRRMIVVADPAKGILKMKEEQFISISTNNFFFFTPNKTLPNIRNENVIKNILVNFIYQNKKIFIYIIVLSFLFTLLNMITSFNFQFILEKAITTDSKDNLFFIFFIMIIFSFFKAFVDYFRNTLLNFISNKLDYKLIVNSFSHILLLPHLYYKNRTTGEILSRIRDLKDLKEYVSHILVTIFVDVVLVLFMFIFLILIDFQLVLIIFVFLILSFILAFLFNKILMRLINAYKEDDMNANSYMVEIISGNETIRSLGLFNKIIDKFSFYYDTSLNSNYKLINYVNYKKIINDILSQLLILMVLFVGSIKVIDGNLSLGSLITFNGLIYSFWEYIKGVLNIDLIFKNINIVIDRINEILSYDTEKIYDDSKLICDISGKIEMKNLIYNYGNKKLFNDLSFSINKGENVVICGKSGCGKSTIAKIISGILRVDDNVLFLDNKDINEFNLWCLRNSVLYVSQDSFLFTDTIFSNIDIENTRDINKVKLIGKNMLVNEIVDDKNNGYFNLIEENGANLSGGERQRIILARTFYKDAAIYILDESFSQIDVARERIILKNIFKKFKNKTIIVISHRFDNNDLFDKVINLEIVNEY